jgi:hypothetical protein
MRNIPWPVTEEKPDRLLERQEAHVLARQPDETAERAWHQQ